MTFDELWRVNLDQERTRGDSLEKADAAGRVAVPGENANELLLTSRIAVEHPAWLKIAHVPRL